MNTAATRVGDSGAEFATIRGAAKQPSKLFASMFQMLDPNHRLTILGTIPPRDVLALGSPEDVHQAVTDLLAATPDRSRLILSCAGGMSPGVSTENLDAFLKAAAQG